MHDICCLKLELQFNFLAFMILDSGSTGLTFQAAAFIKYCNSDSN